MKKLLIAIVICIFLVSGYFIFSNYLNKPQEIDCNSLGVVYLKPSELSYASILADRINGVVVIPELNQVVGRTEVLDCPNFDYSKYVKLEGK